jgi:hypothetical protein
MADHDAAFAAERLQFRQAFAHHGAADALAVAGGQDRNRAATVLSDIIAGDFHLREGRLTDDLAVVFRYQRHRRAAIPP